MLLLNGIEFGHLGSDFTSNAISRLLLHVENMVKYSIKCILQAIPVAGLGGL
jgi:hypothetical protein